MANEHLQKYLKMKPEVRDIFEDLESFHKFCVDYGYVYNEAHLYNERAPAYAEYVKYSKGREPWDQWRTPKRERTDFKPRNTNGNWKFRAQ
jgi:hypothetical protein